MISLSTNASMGGDIFFQRFFGSHETNRASPDRDWPFPGFVLSHRYLSARLCNYDGAFSVRWSFPRKNRRETSQRGRTADPMQTKRASFCIGSHSRPASRPVSGDFAFRSTASIRPSHVLTCGSVSAADFWLVIGSDLRESFAGASKRVFWIMGWPPI